MSIAVVRGGEGLSHRLRSSRQRRGFTLVELLVVIGIIALLISILLPSLNAARQQAASIKCLSNLRQMGVAAATYTAQNKGYLLPADIIDDKYPFNTSYQDVAETWATILVAEGILSYPQTTSTTIPPANDNVFRCPSGVAEMSAVTFGSGSVPSSRTDGRGGMGVVHTSSRLDPSLNIFLWYGINATNGSAKTPFRRWRINTNGQVSNTRKATEIRNSSEMVFLFDGLYGFNYMTTNANRIHARHNNMKITNFLFCDGHAESLPTKSLPGGDGVATAADFDLTNLEKFPYPKWFMDQK